MDTTAKYSTEPHASQMAFLDEEIEEEKKYKPTFQLPQQDKDASTVEDDVRESHRQLSKLDQIKVSVNLCFGVILFFRLY